MSENMSIASLVGQASLLVQIVMLILLAASVVSWALILAKRNQIARSTKASDRFEDRFWSGGKLSELHEKVTRDKDATGLAALFQHGYEAFMRARDTPDADPEDVVNATHRALRVSHARENERLESGLAMLATIGSVSPYVGLFGTVWGIMNAFIAIGQVQQATVAMVAPGIAEALIATAMGLFAAIPAVVAYNLFTSRIGQLDARYRTFADEFAGILERGLRHGAER